LHENIINIVCGRSRSCMHENLNFALLSVFFALNFAENSNHSTVGPLPYFKFRFIPLNVL
jgi:hypothetical protein